MKTMKIIDILNKIANGEEIPNKIKVEDLIWKYNYGMEDYWCEEIENYLMDKYNMMGCLNNEVEILEEEKKIPEKIDTYEEDGETWIQVYNYYDEIPLDKKPLSNEELVIIKTLNQLIDYLKSKGDE